MISIKRSHSEDTDMADIFLHPTACSDPAYIRYLEDSIGMLAIVEGTRVRFTGCWRTYAKASTTESRAWAYDQPPDGAA